MLVYAYSITLLITLPLTRDNDPFTLGYVSFVISLTFSVMGQYAHPVALPTQSGIAVAWARRPACKQFSRAWNLVVIDLINWRRPWNHGRVTRSCVTWCSLVCYDILSLFLCHFWYSVSVAPGLYSALTSGVLSGFLTTLPDVGSVDYLSVAGTLFLLLLEILRNMYEGSAC